MAINPPDKLRVMVDANVLVAGTGWPRYPYAVLQHAVAGDFQLVLSPFIIDEARRHVTRIFPELLPQLEQTLSASEYETVATPNQAELAQHSNLVRDKNDIPVALSAINAKADYLVSTDKDLTEPNEPIHQHLRVLLPGTFLRQHMGWTSEQLEAIRNRTWRDLGSE